MALGIMLRTGRPVRLQWLSVERPYAGIIEGAATTEMNERIVRDALARVALIRHCSKPVLIPPVMDYNRLPEYCCLIELESLPLDANFCGSVAVLVWFSTEEEMTLPFPEHVARKLGYLPWEGMAEDYDV